MGAAITISEGELAQIAAQVGLLILATTDAEPVVEDAAHLTAWQERGYAAEMTYVQRASGLLSAPRAVFAPTRSVVLVAVAYDQRPRAPLRACHGRVARYAWGRDYHKVLRARLKSFLRLVEDRVGRSIVARIFADSVPLLERAFARRAGLGFVGKNTLLIAPQVGSFFFIGEVLWELEITPHERAARPVASCKSCTRCLVACPTGALVADRQLDAGRCISYLTIEKRGSLEPHERRWLGEWVFGCDICQDVCPFNVVPLRNARRAAIEQLDSEAGVGESLSLKEILGIRNHHAFVERFGGTPLMRATRPGLVRNAACVAANTHSVSLVAALREAARSDDAEIVRQHALWALAELGRREGSELMRLVQGELDFATRDCSEIVRGEAARLQEVVPHI